MGTSKGYISPTRVEWTKAKRAIGAMVKNPSADSVAKVTSRFATAVKSDLSNTESITFTKAATGILGFINSANRTNINEALREIGRQDLIGKDSSEVWDELLYMYANEGKNIEDALALDALSLATQNLNLDPDNLNDIQSDILLKEMIVDYICLKFEFCFEEKIGKQKPPSQKKEIIQSMKEYIRSNIYEELSLENIKNINFQNLDGNKYVQASLKEAFITLEEIYLEE